MATQAQCQEGHAQPLHANRRLPGSLGAGGPPRLWKKPPMGLELLRDFQQEWLTLCCASSSLLENAMKGRPYFTIIGSKKKK